MPKRMARLGASRDLQLSVAGYDDSTSKIHVLKPQSAYVNRLWFHAAQSPSSVT